MIGSIVGTVVGIALLAWIIFQQLRTRPLRTRPLRTDKRLRIAAILAVVGIVQVVSAAAGHPVGALGWTLLLAGLLVGVVLGILRGRTVRIWSEAGVLMGRGTRATLALWLVGIGIHVGLDLLAGVLDPSAGAVNAASILLFVALSLGAQGAVVASRTRPQPVAA